MNPTIVSLLGFISLTLVLLGTRVMLRTGLALRGIQAANRFDPGGEEV